MIEEKEKRKKGKNVVTHIQEMFKVQVVRLKTFDTSAFMMETIKRYRVKTRIKETLRGESCKLQHLETFGNNAAYPTFFLSREGERSEGRR